MSARINRVQSGSIAERYGIKDNEIILKINVKDIYGRPRRVFW